MRVRTKVDILWYLSLSWISRIIEWSTHIRGCIPSSITWWNLPRSIGTINLVTSHKIDLAIENLCIVIKSVTYPFITIILNSIQGMIIAFDKLLGLDQLFGKDYISSIVIRSPWNIGPWRIHQEFCGEEFQTSSQSQEIGDSPPAISEYSLRLCAFPSLLSAVKYI